VAKDANKIDIKRAVNCSLESRAFASLAANERRANRGPARGLEKGGVAAGRRKLEFQGIKQMRLKYNNLPACGGRRR
jgi:hypothetical protein